MKRFHLQRANPFFRNYFRVIGRGIGDVDKRWPMRLRCEEKVGTTKPSIFEVRWRVEIPLEQSSAGFDSPEISVMRWATKA